MGKVPFTLAAGSGKKAREAALQAIQSALATKSSSWLRPGSTSGRICCPQLATLFLAFPVSFKGRLGQSAGRSMRHCEGELVEVYDDADVRFPALKRCSTSD